MKDKIQFIRHKQVEFLFNTPPLVKPDREPDFVIEYDDKQTPRWSHITEFYIEERIMAFSSVESPEKELSRIMIDERYGIYTDQTYRQDFSEWGLQGKSTHDAYINWVISKQILE